MPLYSVVCVKCRKEDERFCHGSDEFPDLRCECGGGYEQLPPTKFPGFTVYAQDYNGGAINGYRFKGPKDKARTLERLGLVDVGDAPPESVHKIAQQNRADNDAKEAKEIEKIFTDEVMKGGGFTK